ncbi:PQQ-binding-like beta-propeller repeat protein [Microbacterium rhizomatis]|uniref:PQQ-like beta-propeller repeat protein n=1 Tax=Microbacterium rhizomatis TaxID=1631477 RepID=A0A5J5J5R4_9MICO|nr:PQQ-binding-like beta-propeller repeat protein [Microbacterium rhizomatis]KAA9111361.1 PQQ-like beta-propeller repeat protein [Microbacterium rhizomatis]
MPVGVAGRRRRRRLIAAVSVTSVVAMGAGALLVAADVRAPDPPGAAGVFVPADGSADWVRTGTDVVQRENGRTVGASVLFEFAQQALFTAWSDYSIDSIGTAANWSVVWAGGTDPASAPRDLYSLDGGAVGLVMTTGTSTGLVYTPALRVLAADARPGSSWSSEGTAHSAVPGGDGTQAVSFDYAARFAARAPQDPAVREFAVDGCVEVEAHLVFRATGVAPAAPITIDDVSLWCPGAGIVASSTSTGGAAPRRSVPVVAPTARGVTNDTAVSQWSSPELWRAQAVSPTAVDATFGPTPRALSPALQPIAVGDTIVVADIHTGDVSFLTASGGGEPAGLVENRIVRPGGDVTVLAAIGDAIVVATSQRRLVAYAPDGTRRWDRPLADIVFVPPIGDGGTGILIAGSDGTLTDVDAATGAERWDAPLSGDGLTHLVRDGGTVVVADQTGRITAVSIDEGTVSWTVDGPVITALTAVGGAVYAAADDTSVARLDGADGHSEWVSSAGTGVDQLAVVAGRIIALTWEDLIAFDAASGAPAWRSPGADRMVSDDEAVIVEGRGAARLIDADGAQGQQWPVEADGTAAARYLVALPDQVWIFDTATGATRIGP